MAHARRFISHMGGKKQSLGSAYAHPPGGFTLKMKVAHRVQPVDALRGCPDFGVFFHSSPIETLEEKIFSGFSSPT